MIFLSHNHKDKPIIEQFALKLRDVFGQDKIFYDSWSIQPGDGIVDQMNSGLQSCKYFLFFVTKNSLASGMVKLEWQNALVKAAGGSIKFIPIRVDGSDMPSLLLQTLYIDLYGVGLDAAIRQTIDVVSGNNTYSPENTSFSNLHAKARLEGEKAIITIEATQFMEPISSYLLFFSNSLDNFKFELPDEAGFIDFPVTPMTLSNGTQGNGKKLALNRATTPGHPTVITITPPDDGSAISLNYVMHEHKKGEFRQIPLTIVNT